MAKKTSSSGSDADPKKQAGTLIRVSDAFADLIRKAASFEDKSIAYFADLVLTTTVEDRYREAVLNEAARLKGKAR